ncbi:MAG TPA: hypothetical protein VF893_08040 [Candidatus Bathyarchaeia archaeon]
MSVFQLPSLGFLGDLAVLLLLVVIGIVIIVVLAKVVLFVLPAGIIALVVWFFTGSLFWAGIAFLVVAFISLLKR